MDESFVRYLVSKEHKMHKMLPVLIICLILVVSNGFADTVIPGGYVSGNWTVTGSPYLIEGNITIHSDSSLNIDPAVDVSFQGLSLIHI